ncbi:MAG TPA: branched-chain amino acid ABC transporter substrate-binding protein [Stellaceae bacterium]|nr:branched-chain amino acid ABC transporter substrate-binding protein [Stellaceae bacterium]
MTKVLATLLMCAFTLAFAAPVRAQEIPVGVVGPVTGQDAAFGEQMKRGADMAVKDINAKGGVLGKQLKLLTGDDACDPKQGVAVANQMANDNVVLVVGHFCSGASIPASAVYAENGIIQISPASTNPMLTDGAAKNGWTNVFRTCGRDDEQGRVAGNYIVAHFKGKAVAIVQDKTAYGKGLADETKKALNAGGIEEAMYESVNQGDKDFSALISKMKEAHVAVIFYGGYFTEAGLLIRQAKEQGLDAVLMGGDALASEEYWKITGDTGQKTLMTFSPDPRNMPTAQSVVAEFKAQGYDPEGYTLYTYAAFQVFAQAAAKANSVKEDDLAKALRANKFDTVIGRIGFDAKGDVIGPDYVVYVWNDGKYAEIKG